MGGADIGHDGRAEALVQFHSPEDDTERLATEEEPPTPDSGVEDEEIISPEQQKLDEELDFAQELTDMLDEQKKNPDMIDSTVLESAKLHVKNWERIHANLPEDLKNTTDGRDLLMKVESVTQLIRDVEALPAAEAKVENA